MGQRLGTLEEGRCTWGPHGATMALTVGPDLSCEWAYHEACHIRASLEDVPHADPRWAGWELERQAVLATIRSTR